MPVFFTQLLPNLFYILATLFVFQLSGDRNQFYVDEKKLKRRYFLFAFISIVLCISFPARFEHGIIYDLRFIPLLIGSFYGGPAISALLIAFTVLYRAVFGGQGIYMTLIICAIIFVLTILFFKKYNTLSIRHKIIAAVLVSIFHSVVGFLLFPLFFNNYHYQEHIYASASMEVVGMGVVVYLIEAIRSARYMRAKVLRSEKLEVVSHLAASISHEIRNPMTTTKGFLQLLQGSKQEGKNLEYIKLALDELNRAEGIVRDYLTFAKPTHERMETMDLKEQTEKVISILRPLANMNSVRLDQRLKSVPITGDQSLFQQCILNLLKNSIEAMPNGGKLTITIGSSDQLAIIDIQDTGFGMTDEQMRRLGEPYFTTKDQKGTGLGMMVVFSVIEAMKGKIHVESEQGKGTRFVITIPLDT
ncbi:ATP-binding protein [Falsibacillus pallidus]|uniref:histidine kinase n=1 Tax=Falsibacillus pallidus TaxID=493781 RepID=A0A370GK74_9BACI|nr:ATP-binding protein [Falsibacillus pallidus]RDI42343.1 two-component system sporulation sensor kinase B [Falsibacillus pallidus]